MKILRLICSPNGKNSESFQLSQFLINEFIKSQMPNEVKVVEFNTNSLPYIDGPYALALGNTVDPQGYDNGSLVESEQLIQSLAEADCLVIATPMHNCSIPSSLKTWIDHVVRIRHTFTATAAGKTGTLTDKPVFILVSSGAVFSGAEARQPDFLTPYLKMILATIGLHNVTFFSIQGTSNIKMIFEANKLRVQDEISAYFSGELPATVCHL